MSRGNGAFTARLDQAIEADPATLTTGELVEHVGVLELGQRIARDSAAKLETKLTEATDEFKRRMGGASCPA